MFKSCQSLASVLWSLDVSDNFDAIAGSLKIV